MKGLCGREDDARLPDGGARPATSDGSTTTATCFSPGARRHDNSRAARISRRGNRDGLMSHPGSEECAVIGIASVEWGQTVKAFVVVRKGHRSASPSSRVLPIGLASFKRPRVSNSSMRSRKIRWKSCARIYAHRRRI